MFTETAYAAETVFESISSGGSSLLDLSTISGDSLGSFFDKIYLAGVGAVAVLAVIYIIWGAIQIVGQKSGTISSGKERVWNAVWGLLLALGSFVILQTISEALTEAKFFDENKGYDGSTTADPGTQPTNFTSTPNNPTETGNYIQTQGGETTDYSYLNQLTQDPNGNVHLTSYGYAGDLTPDTNSSQARGNADNLLTTGSVALSPDLISSLQPNRGAAVYVDGVRVGYYDDSTAASYNGNLLTNRVDIYDPTSSLGGNNFSFKTNGTVTVNNSEIRTQIPNPSN